jgi:hypothetical protein
MAGYAYNFDVHMMRLVCIVEHYVCIVLLVPYDAFNCNKVSILERELYISLEDGP